MRKIPYSIPFWSSELMHMTMLQMERHRFNLLAQEEALKESFQHHTSYATEGMFFTPSATHALEVMALAMELDELSEVILPSYTYVATANAFARTGAKLVFVDIEGDTFNICQDAIEKAITPRTKAIVPIHYGGVAAKIEEVSKLARKENIKILEDAAHGIGASYGNQLLGKLGNMGAVSFHQTKNITSGGAGGMLLVNDKEMIQRVEKIIRQGTDQKEYISGKVKRYTWQCLGSEYSMSSFHMASLNAVVPNISEVTEKRRCLWYRYKEALMPYVDKGLVQVAQPSRECQVNGHIFYICLPNEHMREKVQKHLWDRGVDALTHYEPLHATTPGKKYGRVAGQLRVTQRVNEGLLRLPLHFNLTDTDQQYVYQVLEDALRTL